MTQQQTAVTDGDPVTTATGSVFAPASPARSPRDVSAGSGPFRDFQWHADGHISHASSRIATAENTRAVAETSSRVVGFTQTREDVNTHTCPDGGPQGSDLSGFAALATALWGREMAPPKWHERAACRNEDPALFEGGQGKGQRAKKICATCPVAQICAADQERFEQRGAAHRRSIPELSTVRGGLSAADRYRNYQARSESSKA